MNKTIEVRAFKENFLKLLDDIADSRETLIITKNGKAVAKLVPVTERILFGAMANSVIHEHDIVSQLNNVWDSCLGVESKGR